MSQPDEGGWSVGGGGTTLKRGSVGVIVVVVALVGVAVVTPASVLAGLQRTDGRVILGVLVVVYLIRPFVAFPISLLTVFVGFRFGVVAGYPIALVGTVLTCYPPFLVGRYLRDSRLLQRLARVGDETVDVTGGLSGTVAARLSPAPADVVSYGAGLASVSHGSYLLATLFGELPWAGVYLLAGASAETLSTDGVSVPTEMIVGLTVASLLVIVRAFYQGRAD